MPSFLTSVDTKHTKRCKEIHSGKKIIHTFSKWTIDMVEIPEKHEILLMTFNSKILRLKLSDYELQSPALSKISLRSKLCLNKFLHKHDELKLL